MSRNANLGFQKGPRGPTEITCLEVEGSKPDPRQGNYGVRIKTNLENKHHLLFVASFTDLGFFPPLWLPLVTHNQEEGWGDRVGRRGRGLGSNTFLQGLSQKLRCRHDQDVDLNHPHPHFSS